MPGVRFNLKVILNQNNMLFKFFNNLTTYHLNSCSMLLDLFVSLASLFQSLRKIKALNLCPQNEGSKILATLLIFARYLNFDTCHLSFLLRRVFVFSSQIRGK